MTYFTTDGTMQCYISKYTQYVPYRHEVVVSDAAQNELYCSPFIMKKGKANFGHYFKVMDTFIYATESSVRP